MISDLRLYGVAPRDIQPSCSKVRLGSAPARGSVGSLAPDPKLGRLLMRSPHRAGTRLNSRRAIRISSPSLTRGVSEMIEKVPGRYGVATYAMGSREYRYGLTRREDHLGQTIAIIGCNPSKATENRNDVTVSKDMGFAVTQRCGPLIKGNLFGRYSTDVRDLARFDDPIGPDNDAVLEEIMRSADIVVAAWGRRSKLPPPYRDRWRDVVAIADRVGVELFCFGTTKDGQPRHTQVLPYAAQRVPWVRPA